MRKNADVARAGLPANDALLVVGLSHRTASADLRGTMAVAADNARDTLCQLAARPAIDAAVLLSTCNRTEIYAATGDSRVAELGLRQWFTERAGALATQVQETIYILREAGTCRHVCRVAAGLDSMMIGESEILGQIRGAVAAARDAGTLGSRLDRLFAGALAAGRRARVETTIGLGTTSVAAAAVVLAERALRGLGGRSILVIGAGAAGRLVVGRVAKRRPAALYLANRSLDRGRAVALGTGATPVPLDRIPDLLGEVDAVIAAAAAPSWLVTRDMAANACRARTGRRPVYVDVAVPPAIDPAVVETGVTLFAFEDLHTIAAETARRRAAEIPAAEAIVDAEARRLANRCHGQLETLEDADEPLAAV